VQQLSHSLFDNRHHNRQLQITCSYDRVAMFECRR
jgi:hypothetical protein